MCIALYLVLQCCAACFPILPVFLKLYREREKVNVRKTEVIVEF